MEKSGKLLGKRMKAQRELLRFTQAEIAEKADLPFPSYRDIEYGKIENPGISSVAAIAKALNVSIDYLYYGDTKETKRPQLQILIDRLSDVDINSLIRIAEGLLGLDQSKNRSSG